MAEHEIDELQIKINVAGSDGAVTSINAVSDAIGNLNKSVQGGSTKSLKDFANSLSVFSDAFKNLQNPQKTFKSFSDGLNGLFAALNKIDPGKSAGNLNAISAQLKDLTSATASLSGMGNGFEKFANGLQKFSNSANNLNKIGQVTDEAKKNASELGKAVESASKNGTKFHDMVTGLEKLPLALKGLGDLKIDDSIFENLSKVVGKLNTAIAGLNRDSVNAFDKLILSFKRLQSIGANTEDVSKGLNNAASAMSDFIRQINNSVTDEEARKFENLAAALNQTTEAYRHLSAAKKETGNIKVSDNGINKGLNDLFSQFGGVGSNLKAFVPYISKMSQSFGMSAESAKSFSAGLSKVAIGISAVRAGAELIIKWVNFVNNEFNKINNTVQNVAQSIIGGVQNTVSAISKGVSDIVKAFSKIRSGIKSFGLQFDKFKKNVSKGLQSAFGGSGNLFKDFESNLKRLGRTLSSMILFTAFYKAFGSLKESIDSLVDYARAKGDSFSTAMDSFVTNMSYLGNSLVAAIAPAIEAIMPLLESLVDAIVRVFDFFNMIISFFTGKNYWVSATKQAKQYETATDGAAKSTKDAAKAQKELNRQLMGFDEINKLTDNSKKDTASSGGGGAGGATPFKKNPFPDWLKNGDLDSVFDKIKLKVLELTQKVKLKLKVINWDEIKKWAKKLGERIMDILNSIFGDKELWGELGRTLAELLNTLVAFLKGLLDAWDPVAWAKAFTEFWKQFFEHIDWEQIDALCKEAGEKLAMYLNTIFHDLTFWKDLGDFFAEGFNAFQIFWNTFLKYIDSWGAGHAIGTAFQSFFDKADLDMFFENIALAINGGFLTLKGFLQAINLEKDVRKILDGIEHGFKTFNWGAIQSTFTLLGTKISEAINTLAGDTSFWKTLGDTLAYAINGLVDLITPIIEKTDWHTLGSAIGVAVNHAIGNTNWEQILTDLVEVPQKIVDLLAGFFGAVKYSDIGLKLANAVNEAVKSIKIEEFGDNLKEIADGLGTQLGTFIGNVDYKEIVVKAEGLVEKVIDAVAEFFTSTGESAGGWTKLGENLGEAINTFCANFFGGDAGGNLAKILDSIVRFLQGLVNSIEWDDIKESLKAFIEKLPLDELFDALYTLVSNFFDLKQTVVVELIKAKLKAVLKKDLLIAGEVLDGILEIGQDIAEGIMNGILKALDNIGKWVEDNIFKPFIKAFKDIFQIHSPSKVMTKMGTYLIEGLLNGITEKWKDITSWWEDKGEAFIKGIKDGWDDLKTKTETAWNNIKDAVTKPFSELKKDVEDTCKTFVDNIKTKWDDMKAKTDTAWGNIKKAVTEPIKKAKEKVITTVGNLASWLGGSLGWGGIASTVERVWDNIKKTICNSIDTAKGYVERIVGSIKSLFNFQFKWPHIPVPQFSITPPGWKVGDLLKGKIPSLSINWRAKGGILENPTLFGMAGGQLLGGGEAGKEAVLPLERNTEWMDTLAARIGAQLSVNSQNNVSVPVEVTIKTDNETLYRAVRQGERDYNGRYHVSMG